MHVEEEHMDVEQECVIATAPASPGHDNDLGSTAAPPEVTFNSGSLTITVPADGGDDDGLSSVVDGGAGEIGVQQAGDSNSSSGSMSQQRWMFDQVYERGVNESTSRAGSVEIFGVATARYI